ncbi:MAG: hypothetical protein ACRCZI_00645 [Cetobacterium sp.]
MFGPLALASLVTTVAGTGLDFFDSQAESQVMRKNADLLRRNATLMEFNGRQQARQISIAGTKAIGQVKSVYAGSNLAIGGSALDVAAEQELQYEYDAAKAEFNGKAEANNMRYQAEMTQYQAKSRQISSFVRAPLSVLSGGMQIYGMQKLTQARLVGGSPIY